MTIFGISIGTDQSGVCILQNGMLFEKNVHKFQTIWSEKKLNSILKRFRGYLREYPVHAIIVKIPPLKNHTPAMRRLLRRVELLAKENYCEFDLITKTELKGFTLMRTTEELIEYTRRLYPDLKVLSEKSEKAKYSYYKKLYEAVLSAHVYQQRQKIKAN